ncbi:MAG: LON peptidase substrate-binding domain-containing protein [Micropruina sp.]|nr:LON peptidase substrate-binding domain-containing protein [Micropruina sp.]
MFPLGSVLLPGMPLALRIFEERFVVMLARVLEEGGEFGVVLIERGQEVGGGDQRFRVGTVAQITQCSVHDRWISVIAVGGRRFNVVEWLADDPHPRARVQWLPSLEWSEEARPALQATERIIRRSVARASEFRDQRWPAQIGLAEDPVTAAWQLVGIAPLGPLDQIDLLQSREVGQLLSRLVGLAEAAVESVEFSAGLGFDEPDGFGDEGPGQG